MPRIKPKFICDSENIFNLDKDDYMCKYDICENVAQYGFEEEHPIYCKNHNYTNDMNVVITINNLKDIPIYDITKIRLKIFSINFIEKYLHLDFFYSTFESII